jgi:hypothetical protein
MRGITMTRLAAGCAGFVLRCLLKVVAAQMKHAQAAIDLVAPQRL